MTDDEVRRKALINRIATTPALRQEAMELAAALNHAAWATPTDTEILSALQRAMLVLKTEDFGKGDAAKRLHEAWLKVYYTALRDFPIEAIAAGVEAYLKETTNAFFPPPGAFREHIEPVAVKMRTAAYRMKAALNIEAGPAAEEIDRASNRAALVESGWVNADGEFDVKRCMAGGKGPPIPARPRETREQMARRLRGSY